MNLRAGDIWRALYARDVSAVNQLVERHGVTHLIVDKRGYDPRRMRAGKMWRPEFETLIAKLARGRGRFLLNPPPAGVVVYEDRWFWLVELPLRDARPARRAPRDRVPGSERRGRR